VTPPLFDAATLANVKNEIERVWAERNAALAAATGRGASAKADYSRARPELPRLHFDSPVLAAFCRSPQLAVLARGLLGPDADLWWNQAYTKSRGGDARTSIPWHQDAWYAEVDGKTYNCWIAITRATLANGTLVHAPRPMIEGAPGLLPHVWDEPSLFYRCEVDESTAVPLELEPGQAFLFSTDIPHRSGPNVSDDVRVSYSISFATSSTRLRANREAFGDRVPVLRGGLPIDDVMADYATHQGDPTHAGAAVLAAILERAPERADEIRAAMRAFAAARGEGSAADASTHLGHLLAILPDSEEAFGDLLRARARVDQLHREVLALRGTDARAERLLLERVLQLDPDDAVARGALARLTSSAE
jgi:ectoine hydroxylase-related dioxygenase (phytanoyl-CoA dioxygenase family)